MKKRNWMPIVVAIAMLGMVFYSCSLDDGQEKQEEQIEEQERGELPELSIYQLPSTWINQDNEEIQLEDLRGEVVVATMIYTTCKASCPRLVADVQRIRKKVGEEANKNVKYVLFTIDPEIDTPEVLKEYAEKNEMDADDWVLLTSSEDDIRELAAVLGINYKEISPIDFSHSNIISVFDKDGVLQFQKDGLGPEDEGVIEAIQKWS